MQENSICTNEHLKLKLEKLLGMIDNADTLTIENKNILETSLIEAEKLLNPKPTMHPLEIPLHDPKSLFEVRFSLEDRGVKLFLGIPNQSYYLPLIPENLLKELAQYLLTAEENLKQYPK